MRFFRNKGDKTKKLNREFITFIVLISFSLFTLLFSTRPFVQDIKTFGFSFFSTFRSSLTVVKMYFVNTISAIRELKVMQDEYQLLVEKLDEYGKIERDYAILKNENNRLRELLGFSTEETTKYIPGLITGRSLDKYYSALVINKGVKHGVRKNMPVVAYNGGMQGLVGKIVQVGRYESLVMPIYDSSAYATSRLLHSRYEGITSGQGSLDLPLRLEQVKKRARSEISRGDIVGTSGMGGVYPPGIAIGRVEKIIDHDYETVLEIMLEPIVDFSRLEYIFILEAEHIFLEDSDD